MNLSYAVGDNEHPRVKNIPEDVIFIQVSLNLLLGDNGKLAVDGICGSKTVAAIFWFQRSHVAMTNPDGIVDPKGATITTLLYKTQHLTFFEAWPGVVLDQNLRYRINRIAKDYYFQSGQVFKTPIKIVLTSGLRSSMSQASAMFYKFLSGGDYKLYKNKEAAKQIYDSFKSGRRLGLSNAQIKTRMKEVIDEQIAEGIYISKHLKYGAVDVRSRILTPAQQDLFMSVAAQYVESILLEKHPPHFHLQFADDKRAAIA